MAGEQKHYCTQKERGEAIENMWDDFLVVMVLYETSLNDSITFSRLVSLQQTGSTFPQVLVYDNSYVSRLSEKFEANISFYKHDPQNSGVVGAYNYALQLAISLRKKWLLLFDHDTNIEASYFEALAEGIKKFPEQKLFCPLVRSAGKIISPTYFVAEKPIKPKQLKPGLLPTKRFTIINSGLAISVNELQSLGGYDPTLPLDYSDHFFFSKYKKHNAQFVLLACKNAHSLSSDTDKDFETVYKRFKLYCTSGFVYAQKVKSKLPLLWVFLRSLKLTFRFRKTNFIRFLFLKK